MSILFRKTMSKYLLSGAILALFYPTLSLPYTSNVIEPTLKYSIFFFLCFLALFLKKSIKHQIKFTTFMPLVLYSLVGLLSIFWSFDQKISVERGIFNFIMLSIFWLIFSKIDRLNILELTHTFGIISCLLAFCGSLFAYVFFSAEDVYFQGNYKAIFYNSNFLGHLIGMIAIPYLLIRIFDSNKKWYITILTFYPILLILIFALLETRSRSSILALTLAVSYIIVCVWHKLKIGLRILILIGGFTVAVFVIQNPGFLLNKWEKNDLSSVFDSRSYVWHAHLEAISQRPLFGWGLGYNPVPLKDTNADTEKGSSYIVLPEEIGLLFSFIIFFSFSLFAAKCYSTIIQGMRGNLSFDNILPPAIVLGGFAHAFFESWMFSFGNPISFIFWISCIYCASSRLIKKSYVYADRQKFISS